MGDPKGPTGGYLNQWEAAREREMDARKEEAIARHREKVVDYLDQQGIVGYSLGKGAYYYLKPIHVCVMDPEVDEPEQIEIFIGAGIVQKDAITRTVEQNPKGTLNYKFEIMKSEDNSIGMTITCDPLGNIESVE